MCSPERAIKSRQPQLLGVFQIWLLAQHLFVNVLIYHTPLLLFQRCGTHLTQVRGAGEYDVSYSPIGSHRKSLGGVTHQSQELTLSSTSDQVLALRIFRLLSSIPFGVLDQSMILNLPPVQLPSFHRC